MAAVAPSLYTIRGVRIFAAGRARGDEWTEGDIDRIVANGAELGTAQPTVVIGHEEDQSLVDGMPATWADNSGHPAFGVVDNLRKEFAIANGQRVPFLVGDFNDVPAWLAGLIRGKAYRTVSAEIYPKPPEGVEGSGPMLRRVALLGGDLPQIKNLGQLPMPEYQQYAEQKYSRYLAMCDAAGTDGAVTVQLRDIRRRDDRILIFSEVSDMATPYRFMRGGLKKLADLKPESRATLKKFDEMPAEGAPPSAQRQEMLSLLADAGIDVSQFPDSVPDAAIAEVVRVIQAMQEAAAVSQNSDANKPVVTPPAPTPPTPPAPTPQPTSITMKYGERDVSLDEYIALKIGDGKKAYEAENAGALKAINDFRTATKREGIAAFCETEVRAGRLLPAEKPAAIELALTLDDSVKKFGEKQEWTALDYWKQSITTRPVLVNFSDRMKQPSPKDGKHATVAAAERYAEAKMQPAQAKKYCEQVAEIIKVYPDKTAADLGIPQEFAA